MLENKFMAKLGKKINNEIFIYDMLKNSPRKVSPNFKIGIKNRFYLENILS